MISDDTDSAGGTTPVNQLFTPARPLPPAPGGPRSGVFLRRSAAFMIDSLLLMPPRGCAGFAISQAASYEVALFALSLSIFSERLYYTLCHGLGGQTVGKKFTKVRVVSVSGKPTGLMQAFLRELPWFVFGIAFVAVVLSDPAAYIANVRQLPLNAPTAATAVYSITLVALSWSALCVVVILLNQRGKAPHDMLARTIVVPQT